MRKYFLWILLISFVCIFFEVGCKSIDDNINDRVSVADDTAQEHVCTYNEIANDAYLISCANCVNAAVYEKSCVICHKTNGETFAFGETLGHTGGIATCVLKAVCSRCNESYGELGEHLYSEGVVTKEPNCTEQGILTTTCSICKKAIEEEIPIKHVGEWYITLEPRCFDNGEKQRICMLCDTIETEELQAIGHHELQDSTCVGGKACLRCHYVEGVGEGHAFSVWKTQPGKDATCMQNGEEERTCNVCGLVQTRKIYATMSHSGEWRVTKEATCVSEGTAERTCSICGVYEETVLSKISHVGEWIVTTEATCTNVGESTRTCTICGTKSVMPVYVMHEYSDWSVEKEATCTNTGRQVRICKTCGKSETQEITKMDHIGEWIIVLEATCTENGVRRRTCTICGQTNNDTIVMLGHDMRGGSCTEASRCYRCNITVEGNHSYGEWFTMVDPDCARCGTKVKTCTVCGDIQEAYTNPIGHKYGQEFYREKPTCTEIGRERHICEVCGKAEDNVSEILGHECTAWNFDVASTCIISGEKTRYCERCGLYEREKLASFGGHNFGNEECYTDRECSECGAISSKHTYGEKGCTICGLPYTEVIFEQDWDGYTVAGLKDTSVTTVFIPKIYNGQQVSAISRLSLPDNVKTVILPEGLITIYSYAFEEAKGLTNVTIPSSVKTIGDGAFGYCSSLTSVVLQDGIEEIGKKTFYGTSITNIYIPDTVTKIGERAFEACLQLKSVVIGNGLKVINKYTFSTCKLLESLVIGDGVESIAKGALYSCQQLNNITIGTGLKKVNDDIFGSGTPSKLKVYIKDVEKWFEISIEDSCILSAEKYINGRLFQGQICVSDGVTKLGSGTVARYITSITIPVSVVEFESECLYYCRKLTDIIYCGTIEQWNLISKQRDWDIGSGDYVIHCSDGDIAKQ